jgi:hypothetical protein
MPLPFTRGTISAIAYGLFGGTSAVTASYLVVAGGGGGGTDDAGGGGAGGFLESSSASLNPTLSYTVTVGAGGAGGASPSGGAGTNGNNSVFLLSTANGGGGGGGPGTSSGVGVNGGSAGGGGGYNAAAGGTATQGNSGGATGYGNNGGTGASGGAGRRWAGGGGGASAVGSNGGAQGSQGGNGGNGRASSITGTSVTYAGGGGGGSRDNSSTGGTGGGGAGGGQSVNGTAGTANLGAGGGGGGDNGVGAQGGSGIVIISYTGPQKFGGGVVTTSGTNVIHTFTTSGTLSPISTLSASYLIVAGGGGGGTGQSTSTVGAGGGGGAGGLLSGSGTTIDTNSTYVVTVGAGGNGGVGNTSSSTSGANSSFSAYATASVGGGRGGNYNGSAAAVGGSGGGGDYSNNAGAAGTSGQGNSGGSAYTGGSPYGNGGGGGAGAVGGTSASGTVGAGGVGLTSSISGTSTYYAGGGGGGSGVSSPIGGAGGLGGGGAGGYASTTAGVAGTSNTGGGGGGGGGGTGSVSPNGGNGGSGIVIISYSGSVQQMAGGTVTISGGNVIHTFTTSGYLTPLKLVGNSLRFRSSASAYLNRVVTTTSNQKTFTWSGWVKRGIFSSTSLLNLFGNGAAGADYMGFYIDGFRISFNGGTYAVQTNAAYRDPAAWYHVVIVVDTTQATAANRVLLYINGVAVTSFSSASYPTQNYNTSYNTSGIGMLIGQLGSANYFDGYMTEVNFIDGQALTPNSFGTFNSYGVWQPITYGGSYGTNGFYLPMTANQSYLGSFNGSSQYLTTPTSANFNTSTSDWTVEFWVYNTSNTRSIACLLSPLNTNLSVNIAIQIEQTSQSWTAYCGDGSTYATVTQGPAALSANTWNHIALVRSSGSIKLYVNGVGGTAQSLSGSPSNSKAWCIGGALFPGFSNAFNGSISNFRFVNGTAVYTNNFVPPTTSLTAVTNTQLLTLQNATFVDNSTNAFTITNNGTATTAATYPFSIIANTVKDFSPQGNNWTTNNMGYLSGSTLDTMTDVPTLTSATAANYCTLNPIGTTSTLANGNLQYSGGTTFASSTMFPTSGLFYAEVVASGSFAAQGIAWGFASGKAQFPNTATPGASAINGTWFVYSGGGLLSTWIDTASGGNYSNPFTVGTTWQLAIDATNGYVWLGQNNTWYSSAFAGTGNPATGANPTFTISSISTRNGIGVLCGLNTTGGTFTWNFGQQPFTYTAPSGFLPLNTYNI